MAVIGVYGLLKIKILIWEQVLGNQKSFSGFITLRTDAGHNGPSPVGNVTPEPSWNRVNQSRIKFFFVPSIFYSQ